MIKGLSNTPIGDNQQYLIRLLGLTYQDVARWLADNGLTLLQERLEIILFYFIFLDGLH